MADIGTELSAYDNMREDLERNSMGKWVLLRDGKLVGVFESFDGAAEDAVKNFGSGPYLIRQVGAPPVSLPASVMYHLTHGKH